MQFGTPHLGLAKSIYYLSLWKLIPSHLFLSFIRDVVEAMKTKYNLLRWWSRLEAKCSVYF